MGPHFHLTHLLVTGSVGFLSTQCDSFTHPSQVQPYPPSPASSLSSSPPLSKHTPLPEDVPSPASSAADSDYAAPFAQLTRTHAKKRAPGHIPRPPNAFLCFRSEFWEMEKQRPESERDHRQISVLAGERWRSLSEAGRAPFKRMAEEYKKLHAKQYPDYKYAPSSQKVRHSSAKKKLAKDSQDHDQLSRTLMKLLLEKGRDTQDGGSRPEAAPSRASVLSSSLPFVIPNLSSRAHKSKAKDSYPRVSHSDSSLLPSCREIQSDPEFTFTPGFVPSCEVPNFTLPLPNNPDMDFRISALLEQLNHPSLTERSTELLYPQSPQLLYPSQSQDSNVPASQPSADSSSAQTYSTHNVFQGCSGQTLHNTFLTPQIDSEPFDNLTFGPAFSTFTAFPTNDIYFPFESSFPKIQHEEFFLPEGEPVSDFSDTPISRTPEPDMNQFFNFDV